MSHSIKYLVIIILLLTGTAGLGQTQPTRSSNTESRDDNREKDLKQEILKNKDSDKIFTEKVVETVYTRKTTDWYQNQEQGWRARVESNTNDAAAWFNFYKAALYAGASKDELDQIVAGMNTNVPNTFETHYANYLNSGRDLAFGNELKKAYLLDPNRKEIYKELAVYFTLTGDADNLNNTLKRWATMDEIPQSLMNYGYNLLNTVPQNGILVTDGEYDTYPLWILQSTKNHRRDVQVLNIDLLKNEPYKNRICGQFGLICSGNAGNPSQFVQDLVNNNPGKVIYFSFTVNPATLGRVEGGLFNEGLAYRYSSDDAYQNAGRLQNNWELVFKTDYLQQVPAGNEQFSAGKLSSLNLNYVSSGLELYDLYIAKGETGKAKTLYDLLLKLAKTAGKEELVKSYIRK